MSASGGTASALSLTNCVQSSRNASTERACECGIAEIQRGAWWNCADANTSNVNGPCSRSNSANSDGCSGHSLLASRRDARSAVSLRRPGRNSARRCRRCENAVCNSGSTTALTAAERPPERLMCETTVLLSDRTRS
jgi:hypothetical protein